MGLRETDDKPRKPTAGKIGSEIYSRTRACLQHKNPTFDQIFQNSFSEKTIDDKKATFKHARRTTGRSQLLPQPKAIQGKKFLENGATPVSANPIIIQRTTAERTKPIHKTQQKPKIVGIRSRKETESDPLTTERKRNRFLPTANLPRPPQIPDRRRDPLTPRSNSAKSRENSGAAQEINQNLHPYKSPGTRNSLHTYLPLAEGQEPSSARKPFPPPSPSISPLALASPTFLPRPPLPLPPRAFLLLLISPRPLFIYLFIFPS